MISYFQMNGRVLFNLLISSMLLMSYTLSAQGQDDQEGLGNAINSKYNELNPILSPEGDKLYFTRTKHPGNVGGKTDLGDIWVADLESDSWTEAHNLGGPLNTAEMNAIIGFSNDGNIMYLQTQNKRKDPGYIFF